MFNNLCKFLFHFSVSININTFLQNGNATQDYYTISSIYIIGVLTVNIECMWWVFETVKRRAFSESFQPFRAELVSCLFWFRLFALGCVQHILFLFILYIVYCGVRHVLWCLFCLFVFVLCLVCPMLPVSLDLSILGFPLRFA